MRLFTLLFLCLTLATSPVMAASEMNDEGMAGAKLVAEQYLALYAPLFAMSPNSVVKKDGDIKVEKAANYYAVTLPNLTIINKSPEIAPKEGQAPAPSEEFKFKLGITSMNIAPTDDPKTWKIAIAMPTPFLVTDKNDQTVFQLDIGKQQMSGLWNTDLQAIAKAEAQYNDLKYKFTGKTANQSIGGVIKEIKLTSDSTKNSDDNWRSLAQIMMNEFAFGLIDDPSKNSVSIGNITIDGVVDGYAPTKIKELYSMLNTATQTQGSNELTSGYFTILRQAADMWNYNFKINDIVIRKKDKGQTEVKTTSLKEATIKFEMSGLKNPLINQSISFGYSGLNLPVSASGNEDALPTTMAFGLSIENLPIDKLITFGEQAMGASAGAGDTKQKLQGAGMMAMMALPQTFAEAGTTLRLEETNLANKDYTLAAKGYLKASTQSALGAVAEANMKYAGLDKLIALIQQKSASMSEKDKMRAQSMVSQISFLNKLGEPDANNPAIKSINFKLNQQGQSLINGKTMQEVMMQGQGQGQEEDVAAQ